MKLAMKQSSNLVNTKLLLASVCTIAVLFLSCKKEEPHKLPDEIYFTDFEPDISISSVDSIVQIPYNSCSCLPSPISGFDFKEFDIDGDGVNDFKILYRHWYQWVSNSSPCENYMRELTIESLKENGGIAVETSQYDLKNVKPFAKGNLINQNENFVKSGYIYADAANWAYTGFGSEGFIGVKLSNGLVGWIQIKHQYCPHRCIVMNCAMNKTSTNSILAGQEI